MFRQSSIFQRAKNLRQLNLPNFSGVEYKRAAERLVGLGLFPVATEGLERSGTFTVGVQTLSGRLRSEGSPPYRLASADDRTDRAAGNAERRAHLFALRRWCSNVGAVKFWTDLKKHEQKTLY